MMEKRLREKNTRTKIWLFTVTAPEKLNTTKLLDWRFDAEDHFKDYTYLIYHYKQSGSLIWVEGYIVFKTRHAYSALLEKYGYNIQYSLRTDTHFRTKHSFYTCSHCDCDYCLKELKARHVLPLTCKEYGDDIDIPNFQGERRDLIGKYTKRKIDAIFNSEQ